MFLCWPILFAIVGIVEDFVPIFWGQGFNEVIVLSYLFVLIIPALIVSGLLQAMYIFPLGLQGTMNLYYVIIATLNVVMNLILISYYGIWGAIISSILAESLLAVILIIKARKIIETKFFLFYSWKYILAAVFMLGAMKFVSVSVDASPICKLCFEFIIAVVTYFSGCILLRDNFVVTQSRQCFLKCYSFLKS